MVQNDLDKALGSVSSFKPDGVSKLLTYLNTDMLFFFADNQELLHCQEQKWLPILQEASQKFGCPLQTTQGLDVPKQDELLFTNFEKYLQSLDDVSFVCLYKLALLMRSVLLAWALVENKVSLDEAYEASLIEEIWQAKHWGKDEEAENKRKKIYDEILTTCAFLKGKKAA